MTEEIFVPSARCFGDFNQRPDIQQIYEAERNRRQSRRQPLEPELPLKREAA